MTLRAQEGNRRWRRGAAAIAVVCGMATLALWPQADAPPDAASRGQALAMQSQALAVSTSGTAAAGGDAGVRVAVALAAPSPASDHAACADPTTSSGAGADDAAASNGPRLLPVVERLRDSADPAAQAVSLLLGDPAAWDADAWRAQRERVARAALQSRDPQLYELALRACSRLRVDLADPQDSCALLNRDRLLQLDPGNAAAWLRRLASAIADGDEAGVADALYHAAVAQRYADWSSAAARIAGEAMAGDTPQQRYAVWRSLSAMAQLDARLLVAPLLDECGTARLTDANRRQLCSAVDRVLLDRSDSVDAVLPGLAVGWQLGRSAQELTPYIERQARRVQPDPHSVDCTQAAAWARVAQASLDARSPWPSMRTALEQAGWSPDRLQRRASALDAAALAGDEPTDAPTSKRPHGHVEVLGAGF